MPESMFPEENVRNTIDSKSGQSQWSVVLTDFSYNTRIWNNIVNTSMGYRDIFWDLHFVTIYGIVTKRESQKILCFRSICSDN